MSYIVKQLETHWHIRASRMIECDVKAMIEKFEEENLVAIPQELTEFLHLISSFDNSPNNDLFAFHSIEDFNSVEAQFQNWDGIPNYFEILKVIDNPGDYFVFADYSHYLYAFAIRLHPEKNIDNEVLVISGDMFKVIAQSFSDFIGLYLKDSDDLYL